MPPNLGQIESELAQLLQPERFDDYCPNGLQVEGRAEIRRIVSGVTASQALIEAAIAADADLLLVHHGYFWRGEAQSISGMKKARIRALLRHDISLFAYHLPLDAHPQYGNNAQLALVLGLQVEGVVDGTARNPIVFRGRLTPPLSFTAFRELLRERLQREPLGVEGAADPIETIAWCTGAAQNFIDMAVAAGVDAYLTGEVSEQTVHVARESGLHFFAAGHHATERYGVQAVGEYLADKFAVEHHFIDIDNPA